MRAGIRKGKEKRQFILSYVYHCGYGAGRIDLDNCDEFRPLRGLKGDFIQYQVYNDQLWE